MAVRRRRLTDASVAKLAPADREYTVWDTRQAGLGVRVRPSGHRSYVYFRKGEDGARRITLGSALLTSVEQARAECLAIETGARREKAESGTVPDVRGFRERSGAGVFRAIQAAIAKGRDSDSRHTPASGLRLASDGSDHPRRRDPLVRRIQPHGAGCRQSRVERVLPRDEPRRRLRPSPNESGTGREAKPPSQASPAFCPAKKSTAFTARWTAVPERDRRARAASRHHPPPASDRLPEERDHDLALAGRGGRHHQPRRRQNRAEDGSC